MKNKLLSLDAENSGPVRVMHSNSDASIVPLNYIQSLLPKYLSPGEEE